MSHVLHLAAGPGDAGIAAGVVNAVLQADRVGEEQLKVERGHLLVVDRDADSCIRVRIEHMSG